MSRARRIYAPRSAAVRVDDSDAPVALGNVSVAGIREEWLIEDRWWTDRPLRRHYYELALADGRSATVFRDAQTGCWQRQPA